MTHQTLMGKIFILAMSIPWWGCDRGQDHAVQGSIQGQTPIEEVTSHLQLQVGESESEQIQIQLNLNAHPSEQAPRMMELFLRHQGEVQFLNSTAGEALVQSQKELIVQERDENTLRIIVLARGNTLPIETGNLVTLSFSSSESGEATFEILRDSPIFAPGEANAGLVTGEPLTVRY